MGNGGKLVYIQLHWDHVQDKDNLNLNRIHRKNPPTTYATIDTTRQAPVEAEEEAVEDSADDEQEEDIWGYAPERYQCYTVE